MGRRALSFAIALGALAFSFFWATGGAGIYGPFFIFPFVVTPVVAVMMTVRAALMRKSDPLAPSARAFEVLALAAMGAPCLGLALMFCRLGSLERMDGVCGLEGTRDLANVIGMWAHIWGPAQLGLIAVLVRRRTAVARLPLHCAVATILTLLFAPLLIVVASAATWSEIKRGGAGTVVLVPLAAAAGSTVVTWVFGRFYAPAAALRRLVGIALMCGVAAFAVVWKDPGPGRCKSLWTTSTWELLSVHQFGWGFLLIAAVLLLAGDSPFEDT